MSYYNIITRYPTIIELYTNHYFDKMATKTIGYDVIRRGARYIYNIYYIYYIYIQ